MDGTTRTAILEYRERHAWPLTSTTSCYSAGGTTTTSSSSSSSSQDSSSSRTTRFRLATERHTIAVDLPAQEAVPLHGDAGRTRKARSPELRWKDVVSKGDNYAAAWAAAASIAGGTTAAAADSDIYCVGYSCMGCWEALVLMDRRDAAGFGGQAEEEDLRAAISSQQQQQHQHHSSSASQQQQHTASGRSTVGGAGDATVGALSDDGSVTVVTSATAAGAGTSSSVVSSAAAAAAAAAHQQSHCQLPEASDGTTASDMNTTVGGDRDRDRTSSSSHHHARTASTLPSIADSGDGSGGGRGPILSRVVVRNTRTGMEHSVGLDCRAIAPTLCRLGGRQQEEAVGFDGTNNNEEDEGEVGLWLGSPDNSTIQFWRPARNTPALHSVDLDDPAFRFASPVMALDCSCHCCRNPPSSSSLGDDARHCLAVACQDGTIRLVNFSWEDGGSTISNLLETTVIVDGPLVCVSLHVSPNSSAMHAVVGSLGYVCELWLPPSPANSTNDTSSTTTTTIPENASGGYWDGPKIVAEGYWNSRLMTEDPVLAVCTHSRQVAVGTHSGLCMVYVKVNGHYELHWTCQLPYSIHGLCFVDDDEASSDTVVSSECPPPRLVVTTRRSIHVFERCAQEHSLVHDADLAKNRLERMLEERGIVSSAPTPTTKEKFSLEDRGDPSASVIKEKGEELEEDDDGEEATPTIAVVQEDASATGAGPANPPST